MDGVFMIKYCRRIIICIFLASFCWSTALIADRYKLNNGLIRFHVVANSDSAEDQEIKLQVRDAVLLGIQDDLKRISDISEAKKYLKDNLPKIQAIVNKTLRDFGFSENSCVSLCKEVFDIRHYDTFSLPAGVYESLRIVIGDGQGHNWWCVSFPTLCMPATTSGFTDLAVGAGFSEKLADTLSGNEDYEIRFQVLNLLGRLESFLFRE